MFAYELKLVLLPSLQLLSNYAHSLPPLGYVNWSAFQSAFCRPRKSTTGEMAPMEGSNLAVGWLSLSCLGLVVEYWPLLGTCRYHNYSKLYYFVVLLLCLSFHHHPPHPHIPHTHHLIYTGPILMNSIKKLSKTDKNQPLSTCKVSSYKS